MRENTLLTKNKKYYIFPSMKLKLLISYVGTRYAGWQVQENKEILTIQGELERAFLKTLKKEIRIIGAGRTDSGVHADEQCAHCIIPFEPKNIQWQRALNKVLPPDIRIKEVTEIHDNFHAQHDAIGKIYTYTLWTNRQYIPPKFAPYAWVCGELNYHLINEAISYFVGLHDFASFQNAGTEIKNTQRTLHSIEVTHISNNQSDIIFYGNGFLKQMIRNIIGLLVHIGQKRISPNQVEEILNLKKRTNLFPTAPAQGLTLTKVLYEKT